MHEIITTPLRIYPACLVMAGGLALTAWAVMLPWRTARERRLLAGVRGFQLAVLGLAVLGIGIAWWMLQLWLFVLALGVAGEETLETSRIITALQREQRQRVASLS
jgi:hypothetical protein